MSNNRSTRVEAKPVSTTMAVALRPRRGPPRGPIKQDKSTFFGKEGEQSQRKASACAGAGTAVFASPRGDRVEGSRRPRRIRLPRLWKTRDADDTQAETQMILTGGALILIFYACFKLLSEAALFGAKAETARQKKKA